MQYSKKSIQVSSAANDIHSHEEVIASVNIVLDEYFQRNKKRAANIHIRYQALFESMQGLSGAGGKRLRPYLVVMTYEMYGGDRYDAVVSVAAGLEMLHFALLIHDDVIDRDYKRYGTDNIAGIYRKLYEKQASAGKDTLHYAHSAAILAGDISIMAAYDLIGKSAFSPSEKLQAQKLLNDAIFEVAGGELIDTDALFYKPEETDPLVIAETKTAHYSFVTPLLIGATLAGVSDRELAHLEKFGKQLGTAYQLMDDLLGVFGDEHVTGKSNLGDMREGKPTYLVEQVLLKASEDQKGMVKKLYGNPRLTEAQASVLRDIFISSGAKSAVTAKIDMLAAQAIKTIAMLNIGAGAKTRLIAFVHKTTKRSF